MKRRWSIARQLFVAHAVFIVILTAFIGTALFVDARDRSYVETEDRVLAVASAIADNPLVLQASSSPDPSILLQPYAQRVTADADLDFITIMDTDRTRWTHPTPSEIGKSYIGTIKPALNGERFTETSTGTLGPSVRAVVPVTDADGRVRALVAAGVTTSTIAIALQARLPAVLTLALAMLVAGSLVSWLLGRYLRRVTLGWGPEQLAQLFVYYDSMLHSVREGLLLVDPRGNLVLYNDHAAQLLGIPDEPSGPVQERRPRRLAELHLAPELGELLRTGRAAQDEIYVTDTRVLVVSQQPAVAPAAEGRKRAAMGSVVTVRDHTDLQVLGDELRTMHTLSDALRAQTHEHSNRLHTIVSLMELGRTSEALDFATKDLELSQRLTDEMIGAVDEPVISALLMGKAAQANELGIAFTVDASGGLSESALSVHDLVTVLGNLVDNALDAASAGASPRHVEVSVSRTGPAIVIEVADSGPGVPPGATNDILRHGYSTKQPGTHGRGIGLALVRQSVTRLGGTLTIGHREGAVFTVTIPLPPGRTPDGPQKTTDA
ncbi:sensor histidine kinase [Glaciibacter sp. 2TAF33]|uniref:sensor histidine kinase n=1 Tax=Glaciibacter sp. 2TAF33 TaxID=3233015 RepID=UPI003F9381EB